MMPSAVVEDADADDDAADIERGLTAVVGSKDAFSSNCNSYSNKQQSH